jgi:uncharacterized membrane-anchored protein YjiN (DUF445 family)
MLRADALREPPTASPPPPPRETDPRRAALRRMRLLATLLLVLMAAIFIVTTAIKLDWPWIPYVRAFAEAGMVGACADWFAIVALFRRPLGLPIPHTGIVPNNKDRIGKALGNFITNNFLTAAVMNERLARIDMVGALGQWLSEPANAKRLGAYVALQLPRIAESLPLPRIGESIGTIAQRAAQAIPAAPVASKLLAILWAQGEAQALLALAIEQSEAWLVSNKDVLTDKVSERSSRWIPKWIDRMIAEKVLNGLLGTLAEMRDPLHPWRIELRKTVEKLIAELATDSQMRARAEDLKAELLASPLLIEQAKHCGPRWRPALLTVCRRIRRPLGTPARERCAMPGRGCRKTKRARHSSTGGSGLSVSAFYCPIASRSAPISSAWCAIGTARPWSIGWSCKSARTCNISASTERWSGAWSAC